MSVQIALMWHQNLKYVQFSSIIYLVSHYRTHTVFIINKRTLQTKIEIADMHMHAIVNGDADKHWFWNLTKILVLVWQPDKEKNDGQNLIQIGPAQLNPQIFEMATMPFPCNGPLLCCVNFERLFSGDFLGPVKVV